MSLIDILKKEEFRLPFKRKASDSFWVSVKNKIQTYLTEVETTPSENLFLSGHASILGQTFKMILKETSEGFIKSLENYYEGDANEAYKIFEFIFTKNTFINRIDTHVYDINTSFFRLRTIDEIVEVDTKDLFHIPFGQRERVSTQRFSIPGFPCFYVGNSIYVCWEELNRPYLEKVYTSRFTNKFPLKILNFDWHSLYLEILNDRISYSSLFNFGLLWPLYLLCSVAVPKGFINRPFKPEYIFPQFLLQWIKINQKDIVGIRYCSTKPVYDFTQQNDRYYNIVIPPQKLETDGYCKALLDSFSSTKPVWLNSMNVLKSYEHLKDASISTYVNPEISKLQLPLLVDYNKTKFFALEEYLTEQSLLDIL